MKQDNMDESQKNIPDDFWRKTFDEATETPPPRVWDAIEHRLDESNEGRIIPLWGLGLASSRPLVWGTGMAAALALLLVGWWLINPPSANQSMGRIQPAGRSADVAMTPGKPIQSSGPKLAGQVNDALASVRKPSKQSVGPVSASDQRLSTRPIGGSEERIAQMRGTAEQPTVRTNSPTTGIPTLRTLPAFTPSVLPASADGRMANVSFASGTSTPSADFLSKQVEAVRFGQLTGKPLRLRSAGPIQRIVWFQSAEPPLKPESANQTRKTRDKWASASVMPGAFNPIVSIRSAQTAFNKSAAAYTTNTNQSGVSSRADFSVAYQASAGVQLTDRWSVESGVGYLAAHSTVETPAQVSSANFMLSYSGSRSTTVSNMYVDALRNSSSSAMAYSPSSASMDKLATSNAYLSQGNYSSQTRQTLTNDYQFMQVPIQVGYQLRPRKRLSLAVLGGLIANIFVRNTVGTEVVISAKDGVYRPVSLAATMGARFRYRPSGKWSASLAGLYQPSLGLGTQTESQVESRPTSTGMSFGVDYHF